MNPTVAATLITILTLLGLACSRIVERNDDLIRRLPRVVLNVVVVGRYFGWMGLIASIGYFVLLLTVPPPSGGDPLAFFGFVYYFALILVVMCVIVVPVRRRCHHCGKWDELHQVGMPTVKQSKAMCPYQCRHCGYEWEAICIDKTSGWDG